MHSHSDLNDSVPVKIIWMKNLLLFLMLFGEICRDWVIHGLINEYLYTSLGWSFYLVSCKSCTLTTKRIIRYAKHMFEGAAYIPYHLFTRLIAVQHQPTSWMDQNVFNYQWNVSVQARCRNVLSLSLTHTHTHTHDITYWITQEKKLKVKRVKLVAFKD